MPAARKPERFLSMAADAGGCRMKLTTIAVLAALCLLSLPAAAQLVEHERMLSARSRGLAGTGRSFASAGAATLLNPAALATSRMYVLGANYSFARVKENDGQEKDVHVLGVEWTDSTPNVLNLSMGVLYDYLLGDGLEGHNVHLALAYSFQAPDFGVHLGAGGHYGSGWPIEPPDKKDLWSADFGLAFNFRSQLMLGIVGYNLLSSLEETTPRGIGGGLSWWTGQLVLAFDTSASFDTVNQAGESVDALVTYMGGVQYMLVPEVVVRAGGRYEQGQDAPLSLAGGLSVLAGSVVSIDVGYQHNISDPKNFMVGVTLDIFNPFGNR